MTARASSANVAKTAVFAGRLASAATSLTRATAARGGGRGSAAVSCPSPWHVVHADARATQARPKCVVVPWPVVVAHTAGATLSCAPFNKGLLPLGGDSSRQCLEEPRGGAVDTDFVRVGGPLYLRQGAIPCVWTTAPPAPGSGAATGASSGAPHVCLASRGLPRVKPPAAGQRRPGRPAGRARCVVRPPPVRTCGALLAQRRR